VGLELVQFNCHEVTANVLHHRFLNSARNFALDWIQQELFNLLIFIYIYYEESHVSEFV
jgi:hypothetical protein